MTEEVVIALETIAPTDDTALEDRALACFLVACGELAMMEDAAQRDTIVEQLTTVARRLVGNAPGNAPATAPKQPDKVSDQNPDTLPRVGMSWDQVEAVLKQEQSTRYRY
jgi:hypothetical protein